MGVYGGIEFFQKFQCDEIFGPAYFSMTAKFTK